MATETWIINETFAAGTANYDVVVGYISNGQHFDQISFGKYPSTTDYAIIYTYKGSDGIWYPVRPLTTSSWTVNGYRTLIFDEPVTDTNLLNWLQTRAVKQVSYSFKHYYKNPVQLGTGTYKFRPYTVLTPYVSLTTTLTGCSLSPAVSQITRLGETALTFVADDTYNLPTSVQVTGATAVSWDYNTGKLVIEKPTADTVNVKVTATKINYSITTNLTNVTKSSGPSSIAAGGDATLVFAAAENYELPDSITVAGATSSWAQDTGILELSNATGNVTITIAGVYLLKVISEAPYSVVGEPSVTNTHAQISFKTNNIMGSKITVDSTGITYELESPMGTTKAYTAATKQWTLPAYENVTVMEDAHVTQTFYDWWIANLMSKLSTPQNVSFADTSASWDEVENATEYEIVVDGTSFGTCEPSQYEYTQDGDAVIIYNAPYTQQDDTVTIE